MLAVSQCENWLLLAVSNNNRDLQRHVKEKLSLLNWSNGLREIRLTFLPENLTYCVLQKRLCMTKTSDRGSAALCSWMKGKIITCSGESSCPK